MQFPLRRGKPIILMIMYRFKVFMDFTDKYLCKLVVEQRKCPRKTNGPPSNTFQNVILTNGLGSKLKYDRDK